MRRYIKVGGESCLFQHEDKKNSPTLRQSPLLCGEAKTDAVLFCASSEEGEGAAETESKRVLTLTGHQAGQTPAVFHLIQVSPTWLPQEPPGNLNKTRQTLVQGPS